MAGCRCEQGKQDSEVHRCRHVERGSVCCSVISVTFKHKPARLASLTAGCAQQERCERELAHIRCCGPVKYLNKVKFVCVAGGSFSLLSSFPLIIGIFLTLLFFFPLSFSFLVSGFTSSVDFCSFLS